MFSNILVPLDGTAQSNAALPLARTIALATGGTITLLRVVKADDRTRPAEASGELRRIAAELTTDGPPVKTVICDSDEIGYAVLEQIQQDATDLVIMRTHGRVGIERAVLGSVTQEVLADSNIPIMLLRPGGRRITHIKNLLVPVDGSPGGTLALGTAVQLSQTTGASLQLLEVSVPALTWLYAGDAYSGMSYYDPAWDEDALASARTYVDRVVKRLRTGQIPAEGEARQAPVVAQAIVQAADTSNADMIVMSTRALTGPARALLGSTADAVVRTAHCPVLLIHRTQAVDDVYGEVEPAASTESMTTPA
jgi:nucleotide-binding universal stress UspA family protein